MNTINPLVSTHICECRYEKNSVFGSMRNWVRLNHTGIPSTVKNHVSQGKCDIRSIRLGTFQIPSEKTTSFFMALSVGLNLRLIRL